MSTSPSTSTTTLTGFLGRNPIERCTPQRTRTIWVPDPILDGEKVEREVTTYSRPYLKLSVATHHGAETCWHDCVIWNPAHRSSVSRASLGRKGDHVVLSGQFEDYSFDTEDGRTISGRRFVVESFGFKRLRCREQLG